MGLLRRILDFLTATPDGTLRLSQMRQRMHGWRYGDDGWNQALDLLVRLEAIKIEKVPRGELVRFVSYPDELRPPPPPKPKRKWGKRKKRRPQTPWFQELMKQRELHESAQKPTPEPLLSDLLKQPSQSPIPLVLPEAYSEINPVVEAFLPTHCVGIVAPGGWKCQQRPIWRPV